MLKQFFKTLFSGNPVDMKLDAIVSRKINKSKTNFVSHENKVTPFRTVA